MLVSPSKQQRMAADVQKAEQRQSMTTSEFRDAAVGYLSSRLVDSHGSQAATLQLRPSLQKVHDDLVAVLDNAVQLKQNASLLVIGEPGIGKTMVSGGIHTQTAEAAGPVVHHTATSACWWPGIEQHLAEQLSACTTMSTATEVLLACLLVHAS
jgi:DNA-binding NtrC family response regulator